MRYILIIISTIMFFRAEAQQSHQGNASGTARIYSIQSLEVRQLGGNISFSSANDYFNGVTQDGYFNIRVKSNENWLLNYESQSTYFTPLNNGASTDMPCSVLSIRKSGGRSFRKLRTKTKKLTQGGRGGSGSRHDFDIDVNLDPGFGYNGGLYRISILFTLTRQ